MADLKRLYEKLGFSKVLTYIQSGNVLFDTDEENDPKQLSKKIEAAIYQAYGFQVPLILRNVAELKAAISENPFTKEKNQPETDRLYVTFLSEIPKPELVTKLGQIEFGLDRYEINGQELYICYDTKYSNSKLTNPLIENKLKMAATTRNWKTVNKLVELATQT